MPEENWSHEETERPAPRRPAQLLQSTRSVSVWRAFRLNLIWITSLQI